MRRFRITVTVLFIGLALVAPTSAQGSTAPFDYGVIVSLPGQNLEMISTGLQQLGVNWVKHDIPWRDFERTPGQIDFALLDEIMQVLETNNSRIMLSITTAPDWARGIQEESGPPDNLADFASFVGAIAARYAGRVHAYEIWSEPNLRSRWKSLVHPIGADSYMALLRAGYDAVKAVDPAAVVVSAGLAPTGFNDAFNAEAGNLEVNAIDDRVFLENLYAAGLAEYSDAIGANPMGWANPPDARCCEPSASVETHFEDPHFYFLDTLEAYRAIMERNGDGTTALWITAFGWGTSEDLGATDPLNEFMAYTDLIEQARYIRRAFEIGYWLDYVGPMFLYNLNGCLAPANYSSDGCYYSLVDLEGTPRPAFETVATLEKRLRPVVPQLAPTQPAETAEPAPESTLETDS